MLTPNGRSYAREGSESPDVAQPEDDGELHELISWDLPGRQKCFISGGRRWKKNRSR